jgi:uncharacterized protein
MKNFPKEFQSASDYAHLISRYLPDGTEIYLFGSYAKGSPKENSDIDIGILAKDLSTIPKSEYRDIDRQLMYDTINIDARIEPHLISVKHDVCNFSKIISDTGIQLV